MGQMFSRIHAMPPTQSRPPANERRIPVDTFGESHTDMLITTHPKLPRETWRLHSRADRADQSPTRVFRISRTSFPHREQRVLSTRQDKPVQQDIALLTLDPAEFPRQCSGRETPCCTPFSILPDDYHPTSYTMKKEWGKVQGQRILSKEEMILYHGYATVCQPPDGDPPAWCRHLIPLDFHLGTSTPIPDELYDPPFRIRDGQMMDRNRRIQVTLYWDSISRQIIISLSNPQPDPPLVPSTSAMDAKAMYFVSEIVAILKNHRHPRTGESFRLMIVGQGEMGKLAAVCGTIHQVPFRAFNPTRLSMQEYSQLDAADARQYGETIIIESSRIDPRHPNVSQQEKKRLMSAGGAFLGNILLIPMEYRTQDGHDHADHPDLFLRAILDEIDPTRKTTANPETILTPVFDKEISRKLFPGLAEDLQKVLDNQICCDTYFKTRNGGSKGIHRVLVEQRLGVPVSTVLPILSRLPDPDLNHFLHWIYSGQLSEDWNISNLQEIGRVMGVDIEPKLSPKYFSSDMKALYSSRMATHDFTIVTAAGKSIPIHRFVLAARSDVFYGLFSFSTDPSPTFQDQSCISDHSWGFLIRYMYLGKFDMELLKRQMDTEIMVESNWDYFQLRDDDLNLLFPDTQ